MTTDRVDTEPARRHPSRAVIFLLAALVLVGAAWLAQWATAPPAIVDGPASESDGRLSPSFVVPEEVDRLITAYEARIRSHTDSSDYRTLGFLYLEKARTSGDVSRYAAAEEAFGRAMELSPSDPSARVGMASTYYALHEFASARDVARLVYDATGRLDALAILADASLALGEYDAGASLLEEFADAVGDEQPAVLVRQAEWARLNGRADDSLALSRAAWEGVSESTNPRLRSWYLAFGAQTALHLGRYDEGLDLAGQALALDPRSIVAAVTAARLEAATGDFDGAIARYQPVVETNPDPTYLAELADLYLLVGRDQQAEDAFATIAIAATLFEEAGVYDRVISQHLADHGIDTVRAVEIARVEMQERRDVGAWDTLAWALYADGRYDEAAEASQAALSLGTLDARFWYHSGMIAAARGERDTALSHLTAALELSSSFQPYQAERARQTLDALE